MFKHRLSDKVFRIKKISNQKEGIKLGNTAEDLPGFSTQGIIRDGNVTILLKDGSRVECNRPYRVGRQYDYGYDIDGRPGCREWNIDLVETMTTPRFHRNGYFIVGQFGRGGYNDNPPGEVVATIPLSQVAGFEEIKPPLCLTGCMEQPGHLNACRVGAAKYAREMEISTDEAVTAVASYIRSLPVDKFLGICSRLIDNADLLSLMREIKS